MGKSERNKTIDTTIEEGFHYLSKCIKLQENKSIKDLENKTINEDFFNCIQFIPSESVDLIIADPMYNINKTFNSISFKKMNINDYEDYTRKWVKEVNRVLKENGSIYVCCDWESSLIIGKVLKEFFYVRNRITWQREKGRGSKTNFKNGMEDIWFCTKGKDYTFNVEDIKIKKRVIAPYKENGKPKDWKEDKENGKYRLTYPSNFWNDITIPFWSMPENTAHPTQKPEKLIAKIILASSNEGDIILDPFLGSGTTSVVAKKLNRKYIGIEIDKRYCIWAEQRLELAEENKRIQGYENGIFLERNYKD